MRSILIFCLLATSLILKAQDSVMVQAHPSYDKVNDFHRKIFGENYRKEWAVPTKVPVIRISTVHGGLKPIERGGGHQTHSLRLLDSQGKEWVLRTVEKYPEVLIPERLRNTFAKDWVDDNMSAQHPYAALIVPVLAKATRVAHTNPIIGLVAADASLGEFSKDFENKLCLLEEREPMGKSDNTFKMFASLSEDNDNSVDAEAFLRATLLDIVIGDWDRHVDQWRWKDQQAGNGKKYLPIPRDRDQVFFVNQGLVPHIASREWLLPFLQGFDHRLENINTYLWESRLMTSRILNQISYKDWMRITKEFQADLPDVKLEEALQKLPSSSYRIRREVLLKKLISQRDHLDAEMDKFYRFNNKIVDIQTSDKNERVLIEDSPEGLKVLINKLSDNGSIKHVVFAKTFNPDVTREIRLFIAKGNDSVLINTASSDIKIRVVGGEGQKVYVSNATEAKIHIYENQSQATFNDRHNSLKKHLSDDSLNTAIVPTNRYNINQQLIAAGYNQDDGILLGLGFKHTHQGFRKTPFASMQKLTAAHSFSTKAFRINYSAEWLNALNKADLLVKADILGPNNTMNFFGRGNETSINKAGDYKTFYRTRFNLFQLESALRWKFKKGLVFSAGGSVQYYHINPADNAGRFINSSAFLTSAEGKSIIKEKMYGGLMLHVTRDKRNEALLPSSGSYFQVKVQAYEGLNKSSGSFVQVIPELRIYKSLTRDSSLVLAHRIGGGLTAGNPAFYQSLFLGGQDNLLGYRQYRFAGQHMAYSNLELRLRVAKLATYILPGELGLTGFYDTGRVWEQNENSNKWHHGAGAGIYFSPARYAVIQFTEGYSTEGWYPILKMNMRF